MRKKVTREINIEDEMEVKHAQREKMAQKPMDSLRHLIKAGGLHQKHLVSMVSPRMPGQRKRKCSTLCTR